MIPYVVLGTWDRANCDLHDWNPARIGAILTGRTLAQGLIPHVDPMHGPLETAAWYSIARHAEVRNYTFSTKQAEGWHFDGDTTPGSKPDCALVTWATSKPTEFMFEGKIYQPEPFEIVIVRNLAVTHRRPEGCARYRWLFRQRVQVPTHIKGLA